MNRFPNPYTAFSEDWISATIAENIKYFLMKLTLRFLSFSSSLIAKLPVSLHRPRLTVLVPKIHKSKTSINLDSRCQDVQCRQLTPGRKGCRLRSRPTGRVKRPIRGQLEKCIVLHDIRSSCHLYHVIKEEAGMTHLDINITSEKDAQLGVLWGPPKCLAEATDVHR